jgi:peptide deformylase
MILKLLTAPDQDLLKSAYKVTVFDSKLKDFAQDLIESVKHYDGIGIASIQLADDDRFIDAEIEDSTKFRKQPSVTIIATSEEIIVAVNPEVIKSSEEETPLEEGCLSIPGMKHEVIRPSKVTVQYQNINGDILTKEVDGLEAKCWQHEIDHLKGILYPSRIKNKAIQALFWKKYMQQKDQYSRKK